MRSIGEGSGPRHSPAQYRPPQRPTRLDPEPAASPEYRLLESEHQSHWVRNERLDARRLDRPLRYRSSNLTGTGDHLGASVPYISDSRRHLSSEPGLDRPEDETQTGVSEAWMSRLAIDVEELARAIECPRESEHEQGGNIAAIVILRTPNFQTRTQTQDQNQDQEQNQGHGGWTARPPLAATWYQPSTGQSFTASPETSVESESGWDFWDELHQLG
ncbi:predicted protein [Aspergillus nidulans FGSC A4]|uniref:Uncharacterized protein n=1 Tax=Emericella nidulans (strain FGSC A4 / ATCC 38163 / CBS 112.46 / NRRL 194 / M139) TaxID=227321 RepID=Q5AZC4_EMENI|nr:hypothetical protein [Aspergillus nidulans FGSC A4]EAA58740.1 predicted protein [Aspergillus nidulans FGSC A4]CBF69635.1 TPA: conserved hypothetical protein [Aspergillus nidulans FGSC A4]|eukprot:XP_663960.1 predicted protein [Aspergillus nidulans FGSC A4]